MITDWASWLRGELQRTGLWQKDVARALDVDQSDVSYWVNDRWAPRRENQRKLLAFFATQPTLTGHRFGGKGEASRRAFTETFGPLTAENLGTVLKEIGGVAKLAHELMIHRDVIYSWGKTLGITLRGWGTSYDWAPGSTREQRYPAQVAS